MDGGTDGSLGLGDQLAFAHPIANGHHRLGRRPDVLAKGNDQVGGQGCPYQGGAIGQLLLVRQVETTVEGPESALVGAEPGCLQG